MPFFFFFFNKKPSVLLYLHIQPGNLQSPTFRLIDSSLIPNSPAKPISTSLLGSSHSSFKRVPITTSRTFFFCSGALCSPLWQLPLGWEVTHLIFCLAQSWGHGWIQFGGIRAWPPLHVLYVFVGYVIEEMERGRSWRKGSECGLVSFTFVLWPGSCWCCSWCERQEKLAPRLRIAKM